MLENTNSTMAEQLRFSREFSDADGFEVAIRQRIEELGQIHDPSIASVRRVEWLGANEGLALVSTHVQGRRLSEMVAEASGPAFAFEFIRQLAPAVALIQSQGAGIAHGVLTPERIIVTRDGRLVIVEHVLGSAIELLQLPASRLRTDFGLALPAGDEVVIDQRFDVIQLGFIALSLLAGQRLDPHQYPDEVPSLLETYARVDSLASAQLRLWLEGALQLNRRPFDRPFDTAQDAHEAFDELSQELGPHPAEPESVVVPFNAPGDPAAQHVGELEAAPEPDLEMEPEPDAELEIAPELAASPLSAPAEDAAAPEQVERRQGSKPSARKPTVFLPMTGSAAKAVRNLPPNTIKMVLGGVAAVTVIVLLVIFKPFSSGPTLPAVDVVTQSPPPAAPPPAVPDPSFVGPLPDPVHVAGLSLGTPDGTPAPAPGSAGAEPAPAAAPPAAAAPAVTPPAADPAPTGRFGGVRVTSPIELQVFENGVLVGSTTGPIAVMDGPHTFDLVNEALGYRTRQTVNVKPGQMSALSITVPNGRVSINAVPWADVWVDGKPVGQTPIANLSLPIGAHEIVFRHPDFPDQRQTWMVKAEGTTMVSAKFQR
jgi:hypothetical protein